mgnify:FL=1|jgi:hypothetical protein
MPRGPVFPRGPRGFFHVMPPGGSLDRPEELPAGGLRETIASYDPAMDEFLAECAELGWQINSSWTLLAQKPTDARLFPILAKHLQGDYPFIEKEGMLFALSYKEARSWVLQIARQILKQDAQKPSPNLSQDAANVLVSIATADDIEHFEEVLTNPHYGDCGMLLVRKYVRLAKRRALPILRKLLAEGRLVSEVINELGKLHDVESRARIATYLEHKDSYLRRFARKAIERIDASRAQRLH